MRVANGEFMRRFLLHALPNASIVSSLRSPGLRSPGNGHRADKLAFCRSLPAAPAATMDQGRAPTIAKATANTYRHHVLAAAGACGLLKLLKNRCAGHIPCAGSTVYSKGPKRDRSISNSQANIPPAVLKGRGITLPEPRSAAQSLCSARRLIRRTGC
jgi:hypothetical protein